MKLGKIKNDIKFFNKETMEVTCTYNGCHDKFEIRFEDKEYSIPSRKSSTVTYKEQYRGCVDCGNRFQSESDKKASIANKTNAVNNFFLEEHDNK
jgi:hypothetical protein